MKPLLCFLAIFTCTSCDLFKTRDPDSPTQSSSSYIPPTEPSIVFTNMKNAILDLNTVNYLKSFADSSSAGRSFRFDPTTQAGSRYGGVFLDWTKQSEQEYFENMKSKVASGRTALLEFISLVGSPQGDSSQYNVTYQLTVQHTQPNIANQVRGQSQFFLITDRFSNWVIWRWVDVQQSANDSTWSDVKGAFGQ